jgi:hypothetical protein
MGLVKGLKQARPQLFVIKENEILKLTPKGPRPFFGPFLKFGQAIVDAIFVQKISNFW